LNEIKKWYLKKENILILIGGVIALAAISIPFLIIYLSNSEYSIKGFQNLGVIGDFFGGTTVGLLSLSSIIFVTTAIIMQKEELELQRVEVRKTREEYELTNKTMKIQQFENTFFNMISIYNNIVKNVSFKNGKDKKIQYDGKTGLDMLKLIFQQSYLEKEIYLGNDINMKFNLFTKEFGYVIEHYFNFVIRFIVLIDHDKSLTIVEKNNYIYLFFSSLSTAETFLIYYYFLTKEANKYECIFDKYSAIQDAFMANKELREKIIL
jgi:hypothetical protein